jgi:opacity protein-like surface antigen
MSSLRKLSIAAGLAIAFAPAARAIEPVYDYADLRVGVFLPQGSSVRDFGSGPDLELAVGRAFLPYLAGEFSIGYASAETDPHVMRYYGSSSTAYPAIEMREGYQLVPITLTAKAILPAGSIEPWIGAGAGVAWTRIYQDPTGSQSTLSQSETVFEYHAGAGVDVQLGKRWHAGVDFRYAFAKVKWFTESDVALDGLRVTAAFGTRF